MFKILPSKQKLSVGAVVLTNSKTLAFYNISADTTVELDLKSRRRK